MSYLCFPRVVFAKGELNIVDYRSAFMRLHRPTYNNNQPKPTSISDALHFRPLWMKF